MASATTEEVAVEVAEQQAENPPKGDASDEPKETEAKAGTAEEVLRPDMKELENELVKEVQKKKMNAQLKEIQKELKKEVLKELQKDSC